MPSQTTPYLKDWLDRWLDEIVKPRLRPSTLATYRSVVEALIKPAIGGRPVGEGRSRNTSDDGGVHHQR